MSDLIDDPVPGENAPEYTVSEISGAIKRVIEGEFGRVRVKGEVGRVFRARSGHLYYDIKDDRNVLACTTWKGQIGGLSVQPEEGLEVVVTGRLTAFGAQSKYNMNVDQMAVAGVGALMAMLEKRKKALEAEGLFDPARKRPLPYLPEVIGVVTSPSGAVIRDILHRLRDRFPRKVLIWPVAVQGKAAAPEVARAIEGFNRLKPGGALPRPDVLILARGGGSIEDLWGFNEEVVARAAAASEIPLISAVGHETDTTLIDFVSDRRAPTPTAAAEMAVPVRLDLLAWVEAQAARMSGRMAERVAQRRQRLGDVARALPRADALTDGPKQRLDMAEAALRQALRTATGRKRTGFAEVAGRLGPQVLRRSVAVRREALEARGARLGPSGARLMQDRRRRLGDLTARLARAQAGDLRGLANGRERLAAAMGRMTVAVTRVRREGAAALRGLERMRLLLGYEETLSRGYAVVRDGARVITTAAEAEAAASLEIQFRDGRMRPGKPASKPKPKPATPGGEQGSLF